MFDQPEVGGRVALQAAGDERRFHVEDHGGGVPGVGACWVEGGGVGERLERAPRLAVGQRRVDRTINGLVKVVWTAEQRQDLPGVGIKRHERRVIGIRRLATTDRRMIERV